MWDLDPTDVENGTGWGRASGIPTPSQQLLLCPGWGLAELTRHPGGVVRPPLLLGHLVLLQGVDPAPLPPHLRLSVAPPLCPGHHGHRRHHVPLEHHRDAHRLHSPAGVLGHEGARPLLPRPERVVGQPRHAHDHRLPHIPAPHPRRLDAQAAQEAKVHPSRHLRPGLLVRFPPARAPPRRGVPGVGSASG